MYVDIRSVRVCARVYELLHDNASRDLPLTIIINNRFDSKIRVFHWINGGRWKKRVALVTRYKKKPDSDDRVRKAYEIVANLQ